MIIDAIREGENKLKILSGKGDIVLDYPSKIHTILKFEDSVIVMLGNYKPSYGDRNIFRLSEDGNIIWQIAQPDKYRGEDVDRSVCFTYLGIDKNGKIKVGSINGFDYEVVFETGELINKVFTK